MTAAMIADNHLACEPLLRAALDDVVPGASVGGFAEYMALLDGAPLSGVGLFVVYDGDDLGGSGSPHQTLARQSWQVVIVAADMTTVGQAMAKVIAALSGTRLHASLKPLARVADSNPMMAGNGLVFAFLTFTQFLDMR